MDTATHNSDAQAKLFNPKSVYSTRYNRYIVFLLPSLSLLLWSISLIQARGVVMGDYGLFSVLPVTYYAAFYLLLASMIFTIFVPEKENARHYTLALIFQSLILMIFLFFTPALVEGFARSAHSWSKYGYVDYIVRNGHISQNVTHYHNWPVPFIHSAIFVQISSISPITYPLIFPLMLDIILFLIIILFFFKFFKDMKARFMGIMLFYLIEWENQFHFAPQIFALVLLALFVYLIVFYLKKESIIMLAIAGIMLIMLIMTHLLTAFVACAFLGLLLLYQLFWPKPKARVQKRRKKAKKSARWVKKWITWKFKRIKREKTWRAIIKTILANKRKVIFFVVIAISGLVVWFTFAEDWVRFANWNIEFNMVGLLAKAYFDKLKTGSEAHGNLVIIRMVFSAAIGILAIIGGKLAVDRGNTRLMYIIIIAGVVPIFLFYYGVEIVQRAFLFCALPLAVLITVGIDRKRFLAIVLVFSLFAVPLHILSTYGNEIIDYTPASQVSGGQFIFDTTPSGIIVGGNPVDRSQYLEEYSRIPLDYVDDYSTYDYDLYVVYSSSDEHFSLWYHGDSSYIYNLKKEIGRDEYNMIFDSPDCQIYKYNYG